MPFNLRMPKQLEDYVRRAARRHGITVSAFVRATLKNRMRADREPKPLAYDLGKELFGGELSGRTDLAAKAKKIVREKIHAKAKSLSKAKPKSQ